MKYAKRNAEGNWNVMEINDANEESLFEHDGTNLLTMKNQTHHGIQKDGDQ